MLATYTLQMSQLFQQRVARSRENIKCQMSQQLTLQNAAIHNWTHYLRCNLHEPPPPSVRTYICVDPPKRMHTLVIEPPPLRMY